MNDENTRDAASITSRPGSSGAEDVLGGTGTGAIGQRGALRTARWFSWIFGFAMLTAVIIAALHFSEEREILSIAEKAQPWWLAIAIILQAGTYLAQGETWRVVTRAAGVAVPSSVAFKLSLANLFINQALPSGGISGTVVVARALEQRGVPRTVVMASVLVDSVAYYGAYVLTLAIALLIAMAGGRVSPLILAVGLLLVVFSAALTTVVLILSGRRNAAPKWFTRIPLLRSVLSLLSEADPALVRNFPLIFKSVLFQLTIVLLDVSTVWILIRSLGEVASPTGVFKSFVASTLLRTISIVPGGLGVFEAASIVTLQRAGVSLPASLAATLLFRGLSFWLPMAPGIFFSREVKKAA